MHAPRTRAMFMSMYALYAPGTHHARATHTHQVGLEYESTSTPANDAVFSTPHAPGPRHASATHAPCTHQVGLEYESTGTPATDAVFSTPHESSALVSAGMLSR